LGWLETGYLSSNIATDPFSFIWGRHGRDCMVVGFITTYAVRAYYH